jgi:hypothetical protein
MNFMGRTPTVQELEKLFKTPERLERRDDVLAPLEEEQPKPAPARDPRPTPRERWD